MDELITKPQWIAKMYPGKTGRDHLGLGSVSSDQILPSLSPGINVLTIHPRYHSFYVFLLYEYWQRHKEKSHNDWVAFYRPREFIFSLGANMCDREEHGDMGSIVGSQKTKSLASEKRNFFKTDFHYIDEDLGGYGLYFRTLMAEFGLIYPGGRGFKLSIDVPSEYGEQVSLAFREAVKQTEYYQNYFDKDDIEIPTNVIVEYIRQACLCQLQVNNAPDRELLLDMFLHKGQYPENRKETFRLFLDIIDQVPTTSINQDLFRQIIYFQHTINGYSYTPRESTREFYIRWRLYQAREYYAYALNALFNYFCDWGLSNNGAIHAVPIGEFWIHIEENFNLKDVSNIYGIEDPNIDISNRFTDLLVWLENLVVRNDISLVGEYSINTPINEYQLYKISRSQEENFEKLLIGMILMLSIIFIRFRKTEFREYPEWEISKMGFRERLSVDRYIKSVKRLIEKNEITIRDFIRWIYSDYIIRQHQFIATRKLPDNTFRFQRSGNELKFNNLENPLSFMDSRFEAISTTIYELGLCNDFGSEKTQLSPNGRRLLEHGDV